MKIGENGKICGYDYTLLGIVKMKFIYGILSEQGLNSIHIMLYIGTVSDLLEFDEKLFKPISIEAVESNEKIYEVALEEILKQLLDGSIDKKIDKLYPKNTFKNNIANFSNVIINHNNKFYTLFGMFQSKYSYFILFDSVTTSYVIRTYKTATPMFNFQNKTLAIDNIKTIDEIVKSFLLDHMQQIITGKYDVFIDEKTT